jgi:hypothetical protein
MPRAIEWLTEEAEALKQANASARALLIEFFKPGCSGCEKMDAVTYPDGKVAEYVFEYFIPWHVNYSTESELLRRYDITWTPTVIFGDENGNEHYREVGYLPPHIFIAYLAMGRAQVAWRTHNYSEAGELFDALASDYPESSLAPEALYFRGVCRHKATGADVHLFEAAGALERLYPQSDWMLRSRPWVSELGLQ